MTSKVIYPVPEEFVTIFKIFVTFFSSSSKRLCVAFRELVLVEFAMRWRVFDKCVYGCFLEDNSPINLNYILSIDFRTVVSWKTKLTKAVINLRYDRYGIRWTKSRSLYQTLHYIDVTLRPRTRKDDCRKHGGPSISEHNRQGGSNGRHTLLFMTRISKKSKNFPKKQRKLNLPL